MAAPTTIPAAWTPKHGARRIGAALLLSLFVATLGGCADTASQAAFVAYYDATAADLRGYVTADQQLTPEQKARRFAAIDAAGNFAASIHKGANK